MVGGGDSYPSWIERITVGMFRFLVLKQTVRYLLLNDVPIIITFITFDINFFLCFFRYHHVMHSYEMMKTGYINLMRR